jgi:hypothetical protein
MMKTQKLLITLAVANAALLLFLLTHPHGLASQVSPQNDNVCVRYSGLGSSAILMHPA